MLLRSCCIRSERIPSGSLRRRSWYSGHATNMSSSYYWLEERKVP